jgi:hypothetical protein
LGKKFATNINYTKNPENVSSPVRCAWMNNYDLWGKWMRQIGIKYWDGIELFDELGGAWGIWVLLIILVIKLQIN